MPDQPSVTRPRMFGLTPAEQRYLGEIEAGLVRAERADVERLLGMIWELDERLAGVRNYLLGLSPLPQEKLR